LLEWVGQRNLYAAERSFLSIGFGVPGQVQPLPGIRRLADWNRLWARGDTDSLQGRIRYQGDIPSEAVLAPRNLHPVDFRLHSDSAGKGAGEGGRDLGADVDLVGPGAAYERWKKTPEYQQWLKARN
jgi:hypothetical protein